MDFTTWLSYVYVICFGCANPHPIAASSPYLLDPFPPKLVEIILAAAIHPYPPLD